MPKRIRLPEWEAERLEAGGVEIETADGQVFVIPPPELWSDEVQTSKGIMGNARAFLGDRYEAFVAAGGSAAVVNAIVTEMLRGGDVGEPPAS